MNDFDRLIKITNTKIIHSGPGAEVVSDSLIRIIREIDLVELNLVSEGVISAQNLALLSGEVRSLLLRQAIAPNRCS